MDGHLVRQIIILTTALCRKAYSIGLVDMAKACNKEMIVVSQAYFMLLLL
jgi:hypothetical protein